jgi:hypothetical protein
MPSAYAVGLKNLPVPQAPGIRLWPIISLVDAQDAHKKPRMAGFFVGGSILNVVLQWCSW